MHDMTIKARSQYGIDPNAKISMMALICDLANVDKTIFNLENIRERCADYVRVSRPSKKVAQKGYRHFNNCVTLVFDKKAIKAFTNGKLHITGCKSVSCARECVDRFLRLMNMVSASYSLDVIATNVCVRVLQPENTLSLERLQQKLQTEKLVNTSRYNPDIYQGLVAKVTAPSNADRQVSVLIFYTGTMIITGIKHPEELRTTFEHMCKAVCQDETILA
jgi:TATA-box binding protein (TBP) (component of TFIID and TFIIIB)